MMDNPIKYRTIVADPPWHYRQRYGFDGEARRGFLLYRSMTVDEISALPVADLAADNAHLYLWTTNRYLRESYDVARAWGFKAGGEVGKLLVWCKPPHPRPVGGTFGSATEFVLFCRRGSLMSTSRVPQDWFDWPRTRHSTKPDAFLDIVEQVSPGPYVELFARRARFGWDYWGDQSFGTAEMGGCVMLEDPT